MKGLFSAKQPVGQGDVRLGWLVFFSAEMGKGTVRSNWGGWAGSLEHLRSQYRARLQSPKESVPLLCVYERQASLSQNFHYVWIVHC